MGLWSHAMIFISQVSDPNALIHCFLAFWLRSRANTLSPRPYLLILWRTIYICPLYTAICLVGLCCLIILPFQDWHPESEILLILLVLWIWETLPTLSLFLSISVQMPVDSSFCFSQWVKPNTRIVKFTSKCIYYEYHPSFLYRFFTGKKYIKHFKNQRTKNSAEHLFGNSVNTC